MTVRLTVAQALVRFLARQYTERDGVRQRLVEGCWGIFGHGNVAGVGQALLQAQQTGEADLKYYMARNEQAMVHASVGFARMRNRLQTFACTASIGPGSTNMVTGAALATINRIPVLLLPSDFFATRAASPLLQELEDPRSYDVSVNDAFKPVSRFWDRIRNVPLNERQRLVVNRLLDGFEGKLTTSKYATLAKCSQDTAYRDILDLVERGALRKDPGGGRSTSYSLAIDN